MDTFKLLFFFFFFRLITSLKSGGEREFMARRNQLRIIGDGTVVTGAYQNYLRSFTKYIIVQR
jgi:hypothetical protein